MAEVSTQTWGTDDASVAIEYSLVVLEEIRHHVSTGLLKFSRGGIEVGGILYGTRDGRKVRIASVRTIDCDHSTGPSFALSDADRAKLDTQLAEDSQDPQLQGLIRVGWFVSHTRGELALTEPDVALFTQYFHEPWQVALVIRPGRGSAMRAAFFVWDADGTVNAAQAHKEFSFPDRLSGVIDMPSRAERSESRSGFRSLPPLPAPSLPPSAALRSDRPRAAMPEHEGSLYPEPPPGPRRWPWLIAALAVMAVASILIMRYWPTQAPQALGLVTSERDGQLQIQWDSASRSIVKASGGLLQIQDGTLSQKVPLTRVDLSEGHYLYTRQGGDVEVRLEVTTDDGPMKESTRFVGRPPAPEKPAEEVKASAELDAMKQELTKLKNENADLRDRLQQAERTRLVLESRLGIAGKQ